MDSPVILALDQGTTSSRAIVFDARGDVRALAQREFTQHFPRAGWVEHDPREIWDTQLAVAREALERAGAAASSVAAIGIANQRETAVLWDRRTGEPAGPAIVWQDRRTAPQCEALASAGHAPFIQERTGLVIDPYFSGTKLAWMLAAIPGAMDRARAGDLAFGTVDAWLLWNLTGGAVHATDPSNASRTMMFGLRSGTWDPDLLRLLDVPECVLPVVRPSCGVFGETAPGVFGAPIPITGMAGDQQAALFGQACFGPGMAKNTYGTGCFLLMNTGSAPAASAHRLLSTVAWGDGDGLTYALEGSVFDAGAAVQWLRDGLGIIGTSAEVEALARGVPDAGGVAVVPAFSGLGAPHWDPYARGAIVGITRGTTAAHIARATLEAIAFQVAEVLDAMRRDAAAPIGELRVDGGASANDLLLQFQADILQAPVVRPRTVETTALGAAYLAGIGVGLWRGPDDVAGRWRADRVFEPVMPAEEAARRFNRWRDALQRARDWEPRD